jgi:cytochrome bd-type quinol oxidase subunit 2
MVSPLRAFTIAAAWIVTGLAAGVAVLAATAGGDGVTAIVKWALLFLLPCLVVAGVWVSVGARNARSDAWLGAQAALFGLAAALIVLLFLAIIGEQSG